MYIVKSDDDLLYDPRVKELEIFNPKVSLEVNTTGGFDFTMYSTHPMYSTIKRLKSSIEVFQDNILLFRGRVLNDESGFFNDKKIICEGDLSFFNDSIQRPYDYTGSVVGFLQLLVNTHNGQVEPAKRFVLGNVTVTDPNDYITRASISAEKVWKVIEDKLIDMLGGYILVRRENDINYIDYLVDSPYRSDQEVLLGENLLDITKRIKGENIITALIPYGAKVKDAEGNDSDNMLDIKSVNNGVDYVFNQEAVDLYGWIFDTQVWDDVTIASNLKTKAETELANRITMDVSIELTALDLSMTDATIDEFRMFEYVKVKSIPHLLNDFMLVTKMQIDLINPESNKLTVGLNYKTFTDKQHTADKVLKTINSDYVKNEQVKSIKTDILTVNSNIEQTAENIRTEVAEKYVSSSDVDQITNGMSTEFEQTKSDFTYQFSTLNEWIQTLDGDTKTRFNEIVKYIRFVDGNIVLGEVGNELILNISNDRISFLQSGVEVAYLSNSKLYITDAHILSSIRIGSYSFIPRSNGNLSFKWVGE